MKLKVELWTKERKAPIVTRLWCRLPKTVRRRLTTVVWKNTLALTPVRFHALTGPKIIRQRNPTVFDIAGFFVGFKKQPISLLDRRF